MQLFESEFVSFLDSPKENVMSLAEIASRMGLLRLKRIGDVVEVDFDAIQKAAVPEKINV